MASLGGPHKPTRYGPTTSNQLAPISSSSKSSSYTNLPSTGTNPVPQTSSTSGYSSSVYGQLTKPSGGPSQGQVNTKSAQYQLGLLDRAPTNFYRPSTLTPAPAVPPQTQTQSQISNANLSSAKSAQNLLETLPDDIFCLSCPPAEFKFSDAYRAKTLPRTGKENERLIGFATLPEQVHRKSVKKGFDFTLMAVGETGLGKSTLINSLFLADFYQNRKIPSAVEKIKKTTTIQKHSIEIEERGVRLRLTVVDTPGFGDALNCEESWKSCVEHIDEQFNQYFQAESGLNRKHIQDTRIHCCLYFIPPYGHGLRQLDVEVLKNLQNRVNVIPIIAKADTLTPSEVRRLKDNILEDLKQNRIQIYQFPECDEEEDDDFKLQDRELKACIPFAVSSSETFVEVAGKKVRARIYPWGMVEVENPNHSDFSKLRTMLIQSHMHDLKETTQDLHYENFRAKAIAQISQGNNYKDRSKLKRDSSFDTSQDMLHQKEAEIKRMQQMISKMEAKLKAAGHSSGNTSRDSVIEL